MKESGLLPVTGRLLKSFNFAYQPRSHAVDLVQALHVILRMLDRLNASGASCHAAACACLTHTRTHTRTYMHTHAPLTDHGMRREDIGCSPDVLTTEILLGHLLHDGSCRCAQSSLT